jgi:hypothetical protein
MINNEDKCMNRFTAEGQTLLCQKEIGHAGWHESGDFEWEQQNSTKCVESMKIPLPTPCDLSPVALKYAIFMGRKAKLGIAVRLIHSVEDTNYAKSISEHCKIASVEKSLEEYVPEDYKTIPLERSYTCGPRYWELVFEHGSVFSEGPALAGMM